MQETAASIITHNTPIIIIIIIIIKVKSRKKVNERFGRNMNDYVKGNRKLFWKEASIAKGKKVESCSRVEDRNGRLAQGRINCKGSGRSILKICII